MNFKAAMVGYTSSEATNGVTSSGGVSQPLQAASLIENSLQITIHRLNGKNYLEWSQSVRLVIDSKGKLGYLNGEVKLSASNDLKYKQW